MRRACLIVALAGAGAFASLSAPAGALASTYTWAMPHDFSTSAATASNPDHDSYGGTPWTYLEGSSSTPSTFTKLPGPPSGDPQFGWSHGNAFVQEDTGTHQMTMQPGGLGAAVAIGWTSPFATSTTVTVSDSVSSAASGVCVLSGSAAGLENASGSPISAGQVTVPAHGTIYLVVHDTSTVYTDTCTTQAIASFQITAPGTAPSPTLDTPSNGALISGAQPTFTGSGGTGFGDQPSATVRVYKGTTATGTPVQTLHITLANDGSYSIGPSSPLADGQYTAQTEQDDLLGDQGLSSPTTFQVRNAAPTVTLNQPAKQPFTTATPTFTGTADTNPGDAATVYLAIYNGSPPSGQYVRLLSTTHSENGGFSIRVQPGLPDGQYTATAAQRGPAGDLGVTRQLSFRVKVHPPAVTLTSPASGANVVVSQVVFSGAAGTVPGDSSKVTVMLWPGSSDSGTPLGSATAPVSAGGWSIHWPVSLKLGFYTVRAKQTDDAGHTGYSAPRTFLVVPGPQVVGSSVALSQGRMASVAITCLEPASDTCSGTVLILTRRSFQPSRSGPKGKLRVMFADVTIPGGQTQTVSRHVPASVAAVLRRAAPVAVKVTVQMSVTGGASLSSSVARLLEAT